MKEHMFSLWTEVVQQRRQVEQLKERIKTLTEQSSVEVDNALYLDLKIIMEEMTEQVREEYAENSFHGVFWEQQLHALSTTDQRHLRWHPVLINMVPQPQPKIILHLQSPSRVRCSCSSLREKFERSHTLDGVTNRFHVKGRWTSHRYS